MNTEQLAVFGLCKRTVILLKKSGEDINSQYITDLAFSQLICVTVTLTIDSRVTGVNLTPVQKLDFVCRLYIKKVTEGLVQAAFQHVVWRR